jgi:hypothetical protein
MATPKYINLEPRACNRCKEVKDISKFSMEKGIYRTVCRICRSKDQEHYRNKPASDSKIAHLNIVKCCSVCGEEKMMTDFRCRKNGMRTGRCRDCDAKHRKTWREANRDITRLYEYQYRRDKPIADRKRFLKSQFGMTLEDYDNMFVAQEGRCKCCGTSQQDLKRKLSVDHCHSSGKIRGLLCGNCNSALGFVKDRIGTLENLIQYLKENNDGINSN